MILQNLSLAVALTWAASAAANPAPAPPPVPQVKTNVSPVMQTKKRVVIIQTSEDISGGDASASQQSVLPGSVEVGMLTTCDVGMESLNIVANDENKGQKRRIKLQSCIKANDPAARLAELRKFRERMALDGNLSVELKQSVLTQLDAEIARIK